MWDGFLNGQWVAFHIPKRLGPLAVHSFDSFVVAGLLGKSAGREFHELGAFSWCQCGIVFALEAQGGGTHCTDRFSTERSCSMARIDQQAVIQRQDLLEQTV